MPAVIKLLLFILPFVRGYIYSYDNELLQLGHLEYRRVGLYSKQDSPVAQDQVDSYIRAQVDMHRRASVTQTLGLLQLIVTHSSTFDHIGFEDEAGNRHFCCTQDLVGVTPGCTNSNLGGAAIVPESNPPIQVQDIVWKKGEEVASVNHRFEIQQSGRYYLLFSSCLNSTGDVTMSGSIVWMNPYGYLPGELYHFIPLYGYLTIGYLALGLCWAALCFAFRDDILQLQHYITVVIALGFLETAVWYFDYQNFNKTGTRPIGPVVAGVILSCMKRTLSRLLVVVVCMGYGVMKPSLGGDQKLKVIVLGIVYFLFSSVYDVMSNYSQMTYVMQHIRAFFLFPVAALDALFFLWILRDISTNIQQLTERHQQAKLQVYQRFWQILVGAAVFSVLWGMYQVFVTVFTDEDVRWSSLWAFDGIWHILYYIVLVTICVLWRPSANAAAYAYSEQLALVDDDEDDDLGIEMTSSKITPAFTLQGDEDDY